MSDGWLTRLLPTLTLCWLWSVSRFYDQSVLVVSFVAVALYLLRSCATQWRIWLVLGMLALQKAVLWTHSVAIPVVALLALMAALVGMVVASDRRTKEIATASALFFASVSLFPSLDGDVASPVFALSLLAFSRMQSGLAMFAVLAFVVSCCVLVELSPWTCSPILYYMECGLLCLCPIETDHSIMDSQECPETSQLSPCG